MSLFLLIMCFIFINLIILSLMLSSPLTRYHPGISVHIIICLDYCCFLFVPFPALHLHCHHPLLSVCCALVAWWWNTAKSEHEWLTVWIKKLVSAISPPHPALSPFTSLPVFPTSLCFFLFLFPFFPFCDYYHVFLLHLPDSYQTSLSVTLSFLSLLVSLRWRLAPVNWLTMQTTNAKCRSEQY